ncbi:MAG: hypothetical protein K0R54_50 [Clostridiaceae bacterium]|jgi:putative sigma-54 modulation protein|nr:hypothetical protein [Clostridiaceae bacterium]
MKTLITAKNFELTEGIKTYIQEKLSKFDKFVTKETTSKVVLEIKKYGQKIEITVPVNNRFVRVESIDDYLYVAIDMAIDKLKIQIDKYIDKINERGDKTIRRADIDEDFDEDDEDDELNNSPKIVKRKRLAVKPMNEEEAILQMELLGHQTFMFFNDYTDSMCLIYKRKDGNYGIIEGN